MKSVAVLGCGPAGLLAAHAIGLSGRPVAVFSRPHKSVLGGAQFLHEPIPGLNDESEPDAVITYRVDGDAETYYRKVYGEEYVPFVSFSGVADGEQQNAWNLSATYDRLWGIFDGRINEAGITPQWLEQLSADSNFDLILSTVPLVHICRARAGLTQENHQFKVQNITIATEEYAHGLEPNTIRYDGTNMRSWYRTSLLFGHYGTEWSADVTQPPVPTIRDHKPIRTTCDCWPNVVRLGRRGTWTKGVLTHHAFTEAIKLVMP